MTEVVKLASKYNVLDKIDLSLTPYLELPISLIGKQGIDWIFMIAPTQSGKTVFLQMAVAESIYQSPGTAYYILPDKISGQKALSNKIVSMIHSSPKLKAHKKSFSMTALNFDNMTIYPAWSGSLASISSQPAKNVFLDEVRLMKLTTGKESNAIKLANDRLTTYKQYGLAHAYAVSTPSTEGDLLHQQLTIPGAKIVRWAFRCEHCGILKPLDFFKNFELKDKKEVRVFCKECGHEFDDNNMKRNLNKNACYVYDQPNDDGSFEPIQVEDLKGTVIIRYDSIASPFRSFQAIMNEYLRTKDKLHDYKNFYQAWLAKFWIDDVSKTTREDLEDHRIDTAKGIVPDWCKVLTAGIDSQGNGFYVVIRAWGSERKTRVIDAFFLDYSKYSNTADMVAEGFRHNIVDRKFSSETGKVWKIAYWAIDTGGDRTKQVYDACSHFNNVFLIKGKNNQDTTIKYNPKINLYLVRTSEFLDETEERFSHANFEIAYNIDQEFFIQYINTRKVRHRNKTTGETKIVWKKTGQNDYRMADVHTFICLDIPMLEGTIRRELEEEDYFLNPLDVEALETEILPTSTDPSNPSDIEDLDEYEIESNDWWS